MTTNGGQESSTHFTFREHVQVEINANYENLFVVMTTHVLLVLIAHCVLTAQPNSQYHYKYNKCKVAAVVY